MKVIDELDNKEELRNILKSLVREMSEEDLETLEIEIRMGVYAPDSEVDTFYAPDWEVDT
jgi:hypothetical protein